MGIEECFEDSVNTIVRAMKWNAEGGFWEFGSRLEPVGSAESTEETRRAFALNRYTDIFPEYKSGEIVIVSGHISCSDIFVHLKPAKNEQTLPRGIYVADVGDHSIILRPYIGHIDNYVALPHPVEQLPADMELFFRSRASYHGLGLRHKRGALVYGPPGNGKTFRIMNLASEFVSNHDCLVFTLSGAIRTIDFLQYIAPVASGRNNIVIIEELAEKAQNDLEATLRFLDGDTSWNNSYIIATTNVPERLPANLIDRPGRFDILLEVTNPDEAARETYIKHFLGKASEEIIRETKDYSIAYLREMVIRSKLDNVPIENTVKSMKDRKAKIKDKFKGELGFGNYQ